MFADTTNRSTNKKGSYMFVNMNISNALTSSYRIHDRHNMTLNAAWVDGHVSNEKNGEYRLFAATTKYMIPNQQ